ncbi:DUF4864 domain-containing protein [Bauldia sp.]|uniref:DUF4864 domain-containing protein n=1 Tax=Bauldia sp. TaxID=2575872 RepID=UPI003BAAFC72
MTSLFRRIVVAAIVSVAMATAAARADVSDSDRTAIRSVIEGQIAAFQRDDGAAAYSYAAPMIQRIFPTVDAFMAMVRGGYQPVYRPQSVIFGEVVDTALGPVQRVFVTGPDGRNWVAMYSLEQQPDGTWRITGCRLVEASGDTA